METSKEETRPSIVDVPMADWPKLLEDMGEQTFRAGQLAEWIFVKRATEFEKMSNLPAPLRAKLTEKYTVRSLEIDSAHGVDDVRVLKKPDHVQDRVHFPNIGQELVSQALATGRTFDEPGDVHEATGGRDGLLRLG